MQEKNQEPKKYDDDDILSTIDISKILNVSRTTINYWVRHYNLPTQVTPSGRYKIRYGDVKKFLAFHNRSNRMKLKRRKSKYKLAIIEQNKKTAEDYQKWLSDIYTVYVVSSIENPVKELLNFEPDIIIMDTLFDGKKIGFDIFEKIKSDITLKSVIVLFITRQYDEEDVVRGLEGGASDYIKKPIGQREVIARIKNAMRNVLDI